MSTEAFSTGPGPFTVPTEPIARYDLWPKPLTAPPHWVSGWSVWVRGWHSVLCRLRDVDDDGHPVQALSGRAGENLLCRRCGPDRACPLGSLRSLLGSRGSLVLLWWLPWQQGLGGLTF